MIRLYHKKDFYLFQGLEDDSVYSISYIYYTAFLNSKQALLSLATPSTLLSFFSAENCISLYFLAGSTLVWQTAANSLLCYLILLLASVYNLRGIYWQHLYYCSASETNISSPKMLPSKPQQAQLGIKIF